MGTLKALDPSPSDYSRLLQLAQRGCEVARCAASATAVGISNRSPEELTRVRGYEEELDTLDREINEGVTAAITHVEEKEARELLACLKFILELERIGDLLLNFANRAIAILPRVSDQDVKDLTTMATILHRMLSDVEEAFSKRDLKRTLQILRSDAELDRVRNLMFVRHIENPDHQPRREGFHLVFMVQTLERAGDHAKNLAEEICQLVSGRSIRHFKRANDKPMEEMFLEWMRKQDRK
jgi:phosphate transport system protein